MQIVQNTEYVKNPENFLLLLVQFSRNHCDDKKRQKKIVAVKPIAEMVAKILSGMYVLKNTSKKPNVIIDA